MGVTLFTAPLNGTYWGQPLAMKVKIHPMLNKR